MQFTPQQLAGGPKFSPVTRIGNWQEEIALEEAKISNFKTRLANGSLSLSRLEEKISRCNEIVPHTFSEDGIVRFGDSIIISHDSSGSVLACDPFEEISAGQEKFLVTTVRERPIPKARTTFKVVRPPANLCGFEDNPEDPILHIGQAFLLQCNDALLATSNSRILAPPLYLSSTKKNERTATKRTNRQMVYLSAQADAESVWTATIPSKGRANASDRFLATGLPLSVSGAFQLTHRQTNMYLTSDPKTVTTTELGIEYECFADRSTATGKLSIILSEFQGNSTPQTLNKPDASIFSWHFVLAQDENQQTLNRSLPPPASLDVLMQEAHNSIIERGIDSYWNLRSFFQQFEKRTMGTGKMDREDFKACLIEWGLGLDAKYIDILLNEVDLNRLGLIDVRDFIKFIRGPLQPEREAILRDVFSKLDVNCEDHISLEDVSNNFRADDHPFVTIGGATHGDALNHLLSSFQVKGKMPRKINFEKFSEYYADLSAAIDDDDYFAAIVSSNWSSVV